MHDMHLQEIVHLATIRKATTLHPRQCISATLRFSLHEWVTTVKFRAEVILLRWRETVRVNLADPGCCLCLATPPHLLQ